MKGSYRSTNPAPDGTFSLYIRSYWGKKAIMDGTWIPPRIEQVK